MLSIPSRLRAGLYRLRDQLSVISYHKGAGLYKTAP